MANWAWTEYEIHGQKETIKKIVDVIRQLEKGTLPKAENSSNLWEGNVLTLLGAKTFDNMRGFIEHLDEAGDCLIYITATEAWGITDFAKCLCNLFGEQDDSFFVELICEEPECGYYVKTNENEDIYKVEYCKDGLIGSSELLYNLDAVENFLSYELGMTREEADDYGYKSYDDYVVVKEFEQIYV